MAFHYLVRVIGEGATKATRTLESGAAPVLKIDALGPGTEYNYSAGPPVVGVSVTYIEGVLSVYDGNEIKERYRDVVFGNAAASAQQINGQSNLIQVTWLKCSVNPVNQPARQGLLGGTPAIITARRNVAGIRSICGLSGSMWLTMRKRLVTCGNCKRIIK
jgi:hypothetical protein